nr:hypothetical protein Iba_chr09aCG17060 [Ipomoea batatas]
MASTFSLFILSLVTLTCFVPAVSASAHMSPATISGEVPVNPRNVMAADFLPPADSEGFKSAENQATSGYTAGEVEIPAILPEVNASCPNRGGLIETKAASISPETPSPNNKLCKLYKAEESSSSEDPKTPAGAFFTLRKLMSNAVVPNSSQSPSYLIRDQTAAAPGMAHSFPKLILFMFFLLMIPIY